MWLYVPQQQARDLVNYAKDPAYGQAQHATPLNMILSFTSTTTSTSILFLQQSPSISFLLLHLILRGNQFTAEIRAAGGDPWYSRFTIFKTQIYGWPS